MVGSLGVTLFEKIYDPDVDLPTDSQTFDNNISIHRAEFTFGNFKANFFESVVWKKRFELSYLSPLSVYWIAQNFQGDWDTLLGGLDFSYRLPGIGRVYFGLALDEFTADLKHFFTNPRNMLAFQGGMEIAINALDYSLLTIQGTYVPPFFGTHCIESREAWGSGQYTLEYANGGKGLSYPINPDSLELLVSYACSFKGGWTAQLTVKDQVQSAQYTQRSGFDNTNHLTNAGLNLNDPMDYNATYSLKEFFSFIWKNTLDADLTVSKSFEDYPFELSAGVNVIADWTKNFTKADGANYGDKVTMGDWNSPYIRALMKFGFSVYY